MRLFLSADIVGSTAFKGRSWSEVDYGRGEPPWAYRFEKFYGEFPERLAHTWDVHCRGGAKEEKPAFFKAIGDEVVCSYVVGDARAAGDAVYAFKEALRTYTLTLLEEDSGLEVKGAAWIAGFPINNHAVSLPNGIEDYIGPSVDAGFRIASRATRRKLVLSPDLALLLLCDPDRFSFHYDGRASLKGVLGGRPYPIVWIDTKAETIEDKVLGVPAPVPSTVDLEKLLRQFIDDLPSDSWMIVPYLPDDPGFGKIPERHRKILEGWREEDEKAANVGTPDPPSGDGGVKVQFDELVKKILELGRAQEGQEDC